MMRTGDGPDDGPGDGPGDDTKKGSILNVGVY